MLIEKHAPIRTKSIVLRPDCAWYTDELHAAKHKRRKPEHKWRSSKLSIDHQLYREQCSKVNKLLKTAKTTYYSDKIETAGRDQKSLFKITKHLLGVSKDVVLPTCTSSKELAQDFSDFFIGKIEGIRTDIETQNSMSNISTANADSSSSVSTKMVDFENVSEKTVKQINQKSPNKSCELDPIPTWLLKSCIDELLPFSNKIDPFVLRKCPRTK